MFSRLASSHTPKGSSPAIRLKRPTDAQFRLQATKLGFPSLMKKGHGCGEIVPIRVKNERVVKIVWLIPAR